MSTHNQELKTIFIHVPKAAGSSLSTPDWNRGNGHKTVADFEHQLGPEFKKQFVWAFVRDPFERIVSAYEDCPEVFPYAPTFKKFIDEIYLHRFQLAGLKYLRETNVPLFGFPIGRLHFQPMHLLLSDKAGSLRPDFLGRYETLDADFLKLQEILGVKPEPLPHKNKRANKPKRRFSNWRELYTDEILEKVSVIYQNDVALFGYDLPPFK